MTIEELTKQYKLISDEFVNLTRLLVLYGGPNIKYRYKIVGEQLTHISCEYKKLTGTYYVLEVESY